LCSISTPFGFEGAYADATGLDYLVHRYYDPTTEQFLNVDPLVGVTGTPYAYSANDPVNGSDPTGELPISDFPESPLSRVAKILCGAAQVADILCAGQKWIEGKPADIAPPADSAKPSPCVNEDEQGEGAGPDPEGESDDVPSSSDQASAGGDSPNNVYKDLGSEGYSNSSSGQASVDQVAQLNQEFEQAGEPSLGEILDVEYNPDGDF
jgi:RHS repeat-associated protein